MNNTVETSPRSIIIATHNAHKVSELQRVVSQTFKVEGLSSLNRPITWDETAETFEGNARIKALAVREFTPMAVLADDSGLVVPALSGAPGVYSSRFAGENASDADNNKKLLYALRNEPTSKRVAAFVCCLVFIDENGHESFFQEECTGRIALEMTGTSGFGYDPLFIPDGETTTLGVLGATVKDKISHRSKAVDRWLKSFKKS